MEPHGGGEACRLKIRSYKKCLPFRICRIWFESIEAFDWDTALIEEDTRFDYGEVRYRALGFIGPRLHTVIFTIRSPRIRLIGMRKSNRREQRYYDRKTQT